MCYKNLVVLVSIFHMGQVNTRTVSSERFYHVSKPIPCLGRHVSQCTVILQSIHEYRCPMVPFSICDSVYKLTDILDCGSLSL